MKSSTNLFVSTLVLSIAGFASSAAIAQSMSAPDRQTLASTQAVQKTRDQVRAEMLQPSAEHRFANNDAESPERPITGFVSTKSRAQVIAETREAARLGLLQRGDIDHSYVGPTAEQLRLIAQAGERASGAQFAAR